MWGRGGGCEVGPTGPTPRPRVEFWGHCPHSPRANTRPLFPGPWGRGGEGDLRPPPPPAWPANPPDRFGPRRPRRRAHR